MTFLQIGFIGPGHLAKISGRSRQWRVLRQGIGGERGCASIDATRRRESGRVLAGGGLLVPGHLRRADAAASGCGWPAIASGRNTLIFAPTGSGKTLAAFLACLDHLWRTSRGARAGVRILYVSPLKALNQDISRNLQVPLDGILATAEAEGAPLPPLSVAVRSGDTPAADRQRLVRKPPDILITTPESLHLMLTSRARETLRARLARHRRRDPRPRPEQARGLPRAPAGTARGAQSRRASSASASRPRSARWTRWRATSAGSARSGGLGARPGSSRGR